MYEVYFKVVRHTMPLVRSRDWILPSLKLARCEGRTSVSVESMTSFTTLVIMIKIILMSPKIQRTVKNFVYYPIASVCFNPTRNQFNSTSTRYTLLHLNPLKMTWSILCSNQDSAKFNKPTESLIVDFNAKLGSGRRNNVVGDYELGVDNERGDRLIRCVKRRT